MISPRPHTILPTAPHCSLPFLTHGEVMPHCSFYFTENNASFHQNLHIHDVSALEIARSHKNALQLQENQAISPHLTEGRSGPCIHPPTCSQALLGQVIRAAAASHQQGSRSESHLIVTDSPELE